MTATCGMKRVDCTDSFRPAGGSARLRYNKNPGNLLNNEVKFVSGRSLHVWVSFY